jgi:hypothetical protein
MAAVNDVAIFQEDDCRHAFETGLRRVDAFLPAKRGRFELFFNLYHLGLTRFQIYEEI